MPDMKVFLELIAKSDKFKQGMHEGENALGGFRQFVGKVGKDVEYLTQKIGFLGTAATALSTGLVLKKLFSIHDYMPVDDALLRMRANFQNTAEEMNSFKKQLSKLAGKTGMEQGQTFQMASQLSLSYKPDDVAEIILQSDRMAKAIKGATHEASEDALTQLMKLYKLTGKEAREAADNIIASRVSLESFDTVMQRLALRGGSKKEYTQTLGMLRGMGKAGLNNPRSVMQLNTILGSIQDKYAVLESAGIKVRNVNKDGTEEWRDQLEVLKDLEAYLQKARKRVSAKVYDEELNKTFGPNARQNLDFVFKQKENFQKGIEEMGRAAEIAERRIAAGEATWEAQLDKIKSNLSGIKNDLSFIYDLAKKPIKFVADSPNLTKAAGYTAAGLSVAVLSALSYGNIKSTLKGLAATGAGIVVGKEIQSVTGVTPVFVVNMPAGGIAGGGIPDTVKKAGVTATIAGWLQTLALPALAGSAAYSFYKYPGLSGGPLASDNSGGKGKLSPEQEKFLAETATWGKEHGLHDYKKERDLPLIYNDVYKQEYQRGGEKDKYVLNFQISNDRLFGDTSKLNPNIEINLLRGNFGY